MEGKMKKQTFHGDLTEQIRPLMNEKTKHDVIIRTHIRGNLLTEENKRINGSLRHIKLFLLVICSFMRKWLIEKGL